MMELSDYHGVKVYLVGGAVRDELLKLPAKDNDYVVTGATPAMMLAAGFERVGNHFPVFLHPETGDEYALARTERSTGTGYGDFTVNFNPDTTIEQDLYRRDLTINAIAKDLETGEYIDPYGGRRDIKAQVLRACNLLAFKEDPVRVLRLARFKARFPGFAIDPQSEIVIKQVAPQWCQLDRVRAETEKALMEIKPSEYFNALKRFGWLWEWFREVEALIGVTQPVRWHAEGDAYVHTMMVLDAAAHYGEDLLTRWGCLLHDLGKALTPRDKLPSHPGHEAAGVVPVQQFCERFGMSEAKTRILMNCSKYHMHVHKINNLRPITIVRMAEALRTEDNVLLLSKIGKYDNMGRLPYVDYGNTSTVFYLTATAVLNTKISSAFSQEEIATMSVDQIKNRLQRMRMEAAYSVRKGLADGVFNY